MAVVEVEEAEEEEEEEAAAAKEFCSWFWRRYRSRREMVAKRRKMWIAK